MPEEEPTVSVYVCSGVEGPCLVINDRRVAGPKPWGGGEVTHEWKVRVSELREALAALDEKGGGA